MSKKRTKADRLQRNVDRLEKRDDARPEIDDQRLEPTSTTPAVSQLEEQIRQRAYELFEERGREDGYDLDDWLRAEKEITKQKTRTTAA